MAPGAHNGPLGARKAFRHRAAEWAHGGPHDAYCLVRDRYPGGFDRVPRARASRAAAARVRRVTGRRRQGPDRRAAQSAGPGHRGQWKPDFTYETLRKGTNRLVCYDRSGFPQQQPFSVQCTSIANLTRVAQNLKAEAAGDRADRRRTQRQAGCRSGSARGAFAWLCGSSHRRCPPQVAERPGAAAWTMEIGRVHREAA